MRRGKFAAAVLAFVLALSSGVSAVYADAPERKDFSGKVEFLRQEEGRYVFQVTAANAGNDFTGAVRLMFASHNTEACAFDTELVLPKDGQKQFALAIPENAVDSARGTCEMSFLDEKGKLLETITFKNVFGNAKSGFGVGILSDSYDDLTYLDLGGADFDALGKSEPIKLIALDQENLAANLDGLYYLVIDRFDVASLGEENIRLIQNWVENGGWLVIGTGEYGEQTLGGFDEDFLGLEAGKISEPGEANYLSDEMQNNPDMFWMYRDAGIDFRNMAVMEPVFQYNGYSFDQNWVQPCFCASAGDGSVSVFLFSLAEPELKRKGYQAFYRSMLEESMNYARSASYYYDRSDMEYLGQNALARIDHENTSVDFGWLKLLIVAYVVLAGPVLYLLLRKGKKSECYWIGVPLLGIVFIALVFFFGKGIRLTETKVYSVSLQKVDGTWQDSYYDAYRSGTRPWSLRLADSYELAGAGFSGGGYYYSGTIGDYHYLARKDSQGLSIGMKPRENFESAYLYAGGRTAPAGTFDARGLAARWGNAGWQFAGTVTNATDEDLAYLAVASPDGQLMIFSDVKAGETLDLAAEAGTGRCIYSAQGKDYHKLYYDLNERRPLTVTVDAVDELMALFIGIGMTTDRGEQSIYQTSPGDEERQARIIGLVRNASATIASRCEEKAYRCLYGDAEMEVVAYAED